MLRWLKSRLALPHTSNRLSCFNEYSIRIARPDLFSATDGICDDCPFTTVSSWTCSAPSSIHRSLVLPPSITVTPQALKFTQRCSDTYRPDNPALLAIRRRRRAQITLIDLLLDNLFRSRSIPALCGAATTFNTVLSVGIYPRRSLKIPEISAFFRQHVIRTLFQSAEILLL